jgi:hypothetical protein
MLPEALDHLLISLASPNASQNCQIVMVIRACILDKRIQCNLRLRTAVELNVPFAVLIIVISRVWNITWASSLRRMRGA